jgi:hypothetical protein
MAGFFQDNQRNQIIKRLLKMKKITIYFCLIITFLNFIKIEKEVIFAKEQQEEKCIQPFFFNKISRLRGKKSEGFAESSTWNTFKGYMPLIKESSLWRSMPDDFKIKFKSYFKEVARLMQSEKKYDGSEDIWLNDLRVIFLGGDNFKGDPKILNNLRLSLRPRNLQICQNEFIASQQNAKKLNIEESFDLSRSRFFLNYKNSYSQKNIAKSDEIGIKSILSGIFNYFSYGKKKERKKEEQNNKFQAMDRVFSKYKFKNNITENYKQWQKMRNRILFEKIKYTSPSIDKYRAKRLKISEKIKETESVLNDIDKDWQDIFNRQNVNCSTCP